jgi:outer membrane protein assembly factor BamB
MDFENDFDIELSDSVFQKKYSLTWDHEYGGTVVCVPAVSDGIVYFGCDNYNFYALDVKTGKEIWKFKSGGCAGNYTPVVVDDTVFFGSYDGYLYRFNKKNGKLLWKFKTGGKVVSGICHHEGRVVFGSRDSFVYCLDMEGVELWRFRTGGEVISTPVIDNDYTYIGSYDGCVYCLSLKDGSEIWRFVTGGAVGNLCPINIYGDRLYFGSWDLNMYCLDRMTGKELWKHHVGRGILSGGAVYDGVLYFGSKMDCLHAVSAETGSEIWKLKTAHHTHASNICAFNGNVYFGGGEDEYKRGLVCCADTKGTILWEFVTNGPAWAGPNIIDGELFVGSWNGYFYKLNPETGKDVWSFRTGSSASKEKVIDNSEVAFITIVTGKGAKESEEKGSSYSATQEIHNILDNTYIAKSEYSFGSKTYKSETGYR